MFLFQICRITTSYICVSFMPLSSFLFNVTTLSVELQNPSFSVYSLPLFPYVYPLFLQGNVDITDHKIVPADAQLASDYHSVSSENPPAKKARDMHAVSTCFTFFNYSNKVSHKDILLLEWDSWPQVYCWIHLSSCSFHKRHQRVFMSCSAEPTLMVFLKDAETDGTVM